MACASSVAASRSARNGSINSRRVSRTCLRNATPLAPFIRLAMKVFTSPLTGLKPSPSAFTAEAKLAKAQMDTSCPRRLSSRPNTR